MTKHITRQLAGWTASLVALAATASAEVKINDYLSLSGYAAAAGTITDTTPAANPKDTLFNSGFGNLDSALFAVNGKYKGFSSKVSLFYVPARGSDNSGILDAYVSYTAGDFTVTAGKFLSYLGYESFYAANMNQLTYGSTIADIPGYHTGAKVDYATKDFAAGVAVVDSLFGGAGFNQGDGDFGEVGTEAYISYTGIDKLTIFEGIGYGDQDNDAVDSFVNDLWVSYAATDKLTLAAEYTYRSANAANKNNGWLLFGQYLFTDKFSAIARVSGIKNKGGDAGTNFTIAPSYKVTGNLTLRGEISYADSAEGDSVTNGTAKGAFYGVQALFTF